MSDKYRYSDKYFFTEHEKKRTYIQWYRTKDAMMNSREYKNNIKNRFIVAHKLPSIEGGEPEITFACFENAMTFSEAIDIIFRDCISDWPLFSDKPFTTTATGRDTRQKERQKRHRTSYPEMNFYECIEGDREQKPHFDFDFSLTEDNKDIFHWLKRDLDGRVLTPLLKAMNLELYEQLKLDRVMIFSSHSDAKISFHILLQDHYHNDHKEAKEFYDMVVERLTTDKHFTNLLFDVAQVNWKIDWIDLGSCIQIINSRTPEKKKETERLRQ